jgi:hypothetical protein
VKEEVDPDVIFWTGDAVAHDLTDYDLAYVEKIQSFFTDYVKSNLSDYVFYPIQGNHDFATLNY